MSAGGYFPLWRSILQSSINEEDVVTRWVWMTMLISATRDGMMKATPDAIARLANVPLEECQRSLTVLSGPDPRSSSEEEGGRRIIETSPNWWRLVNYEYYRDLARADRGREKDAERARRYRQRKDRHGASQSVTDDSKKDVTERDRHGAVTNSASGSGLGLVSGKKKGSEEGKKKRTAKRFKKPTVEEVGAYLLERGETRFTAQEFVDSNETKGWVVGTTKTPMKNWKAAVRTWINNRNKRGEPQLADAINETTGLTDFEDWLADTVRRSDRDNFGNHSMWPDYENAACEFPPRSAPKFETWLRGQMEA